MKDSILKVKSKAFARRILELSKFLQSEKKEFDMSKQLLRSGTSIGANIAESTYAQSQADFISKLSIALKEAAESEFWLDLLADGEYISEEQKKSYRGDCIELIRILISIINTTKSKNSPKNKC